jgi:hypothetical protein
MHSFQSPDSSAAHKPRLSPQLLARIRAEYREMPGLRLTLHEARRFWGLDIRTCSAALAALRASGFLSSTRDGAFVRAEGT